MVCFVLLAVAVSDHAPGVPDDDERPQTPIPRALRADSAASRSAAECAHCNRDTGVVMRSVSRAARSEGHQVVDFQDVHENCCNLAPRNLRRRVMDNVYKTTEIVGSSSAGMEDAVKRAVAKASQSLRHMRWFEVSEIRGHIEDGEIGHWQVTVKVGFTME
jgi:flavin-binding protein dodecin